MATDVNIAALFEIIDSAKTGTISKQQFRAAASKLGRRGSIAPTDVDELVRLFCRIRSTLKGKVTLKEFVAGFRGSKHKGFTQWMEVRAVC